MRAVRALSKFVDRELHHSEVQFGQNVTDAGNIRIIGAIAVGDESNNRNGIQVTMRSMQLRYQLTIGNNDGVTRIVVLIDRQSNGVLPTFAEVFEVATSGISTVNSVYEIDHIKRFKIIYDRRHVFTGVRVPIQVGAVRRRLTHKIRYDGAGTTIADVVSGAVILLMISTTTGGANSPNVEMFGRFKFAP